MSSVELTERGRKSILLLFITLFFAALFSDPFILAASLFLGGFLSYDYLKVRSALDNAENLVKLEPERVEEILNADEMLEQEVEVTNSSGLTVEINVPIEDVFLVTSVYEEGTATTDLIFNPDLAGKFRLEGIETEFVGNIGLFRGSGEVPFELSLEVRPRVLAAAVRAARFLAASEGLGEGDRPLELKGAGLEYAGLREYQPGDELRHLDWKATARLDRPIVKEFYMEGGGGIHFLYDSRAPDPVSRDELSATFLNATLTAAQEGVPIGLTVQDGDRLIANRKEMEPKTAVALALRYSLETSDAEVEEFYSVLEPATTREVRGSMERLKGDSFSEIVMGGRKRNDHRVGTEKALRGIIDSSEGNLQIGVVSSLSGDISQFLELEDYSRQKGSLLSVLQPTKPWKRVEDLAESYRIHEKYSRAYRVFQKRCIKVEADVESFFRSLPSRERDTVL